MKAPNYDWGDLVSYVGLLVGLGVSYVTLPAFGVTHQLALVVVGVLGGAGLGYYMEQWFRRKTGLTRREDD